MARVKAEAVWQAKFHRMRREAWWGVVLGLCAVIYAIYSIKQKILNPGWDFGEPLWGNPYAIGFAWGTAGILIPVSLALLFWSGAAMKLARDFRGIGVGLVGVFFSVIVLGTWVWGYNTRMVITDEVQQEGWTLGLFTSLVAVSATKTIFLGLTGHPMWKVHGRVKSKRFTRRSETPRYTDDEYMDERPVDDSDNLRIVNNTAPRRHHSSTEPTM